MRNTFTREHGSAECEFGFVAPRQLVLRVRGVLTSAAAPLVAAHLDMVASKALATSVLVDLSRAVVTLNEAQLNATPQMLPYATRVLPIAIVPPPGVVELFREHAWCAAKLGLLRGVFEDQEPAHRWLEQKAVASCLYSRTPVSAR